MASNNDTARKLDFTPKAYKPQGLSQFEKSFSPLSARAAENLDKNKKIPYERLFVIIDLLK